MTTAERIATETFAGLEARLLDAARLHFRCEVNAHGAYDAELQGNVDIRRNNIAELAFVGDFRGRRADPRLISNGKQMCGGSLETDFDQPTPDHLRQALIIGFTRMGILHNLARLSFGIAPDHADDEARDWIVPHQFEQGDSERIDGQLAYAIHFELRVGGRSAGEATLWLSEHEDLPLQRKQTVHFPDGDMFVTEHYQWLAVNE